MYLKSAISDGKVIKGNQNYPKNHDLVWRVHTSNGYDIIQGTEGGKAENRPFDEYNGDYEYNDKNVNKHKNIVALCRAVPGTEK